MHSFDALSLRLGVLLNLRTSRHIDLPQRRCLWRMKCDQQVGNDLLVTRLRTEVSLSGIAGLTFPIQRIGTVSVLAACIAIVNISALTNRENTYEKVCSLREIYKTRN